MDCPKCNLRYNIVNRKPKVIQCGHTLCQACCNKLILCHTCQKVFDKSKSNINFSLMEMLKEKKDTKDIDKLIKVCFIGESTVGKTSLINRLKGQAYKENTITTIGYDFAFEDREIDGLNVRFQLWDSAGQERYRAISPLHYKNSDIIIIVYDVTKNGKVNNISHWIEEANHHCPQNVIKLIVGNKIDLLENMNTTPFNPLDSVAWKVIAQQKINKYELSCKTYIGVEQFWQILDKTVRTIIKRINFGQNPFKKPKEIAPKSPRMKKKPSSATQATKLSKRPVSQTSTQTRERCQC